MGESLAVGWCESARGSAACLRWGGEQAGETLAQHRKFVLICFPVIPPSGQVTQLPGELVWCSRVPPQQKGPQNPRRYLWLLLQTHAAAALTGCAGIYSSPH